MELKETICIILRQTPFQESSRILGCLSPDFGRIDFLMKGAVTSGRKTFPAAGLFRELSVTFRPPNRGSELCSVRSRELRTSFDAIAMHTENYLAMCSFARFLLANTRPGVEYPETYGALRMLLQRFSSGTPEEPALTLASLAFLHESGLIPDLKTPEREETFSRLLHQAQEDPLPDFDEAFLRKLRLWKDSLLRKNRINLV